MTNGTMPETLARPMAGLAVILMLLPGCSGSSTNDNDAGDPDAGDSGVEPDGGTFNPDDHFAVDVACGGEHTCALTRSGKVVCWGYNHVGQLGGSQYQYEDWEKITPLSDGAISVSAGSWNTCAIMEDGRLLCWGYNLYHQLGGDFSGYEGDEPVEVMYLDSAAIDVSMGDSHICAVLVDGSVSCWGKNNHGEVGDGVDLSLCEEAFDCLVPWATTVEGVSDAIGIGAGAGSTCVVESDGSVKCWGRWNGTDQPTSSPLEIAGLTASAESVKQLDYVCTLLLDGNLMCWGLNDFGELGNGTQDMSWTPVEVKNLDGKAVDMAVGGSHACALLDDGRVQCWGRNRYGTLGIGELTDLSLVPVDVVGLESEVVSIDAGGLHTCAVIDDGSIQCWGLGSYCQLGNDLDPQDCEEWDDCLFPTPVDVVGFGPDYMTPPEEE